MNEQNEKAKDQNEGRQNATGAEEVKFVRLVEADTPAGIRVIYFDGKKEIELDMVTFTEVALFRLTDERFRRRELRPLEKMKEEAFGESVHGSPGIDRMFPRRSEDSKLFFG